jgi:hypothetical protein
MNVVVEEEGVAINSKPGRDIEERIGSFDVKI